MKRVVLTRIETKEFFLHAKFSHHLFCVDQFKYQHLSFAFVRSLLNFAHLYDMHFIQCECVHIYHQGKLHNWIGSAKEIIKFNNLVLLQWMRPATWYFQCKTVLSIPKKNRCWFANLPKGIEWVVVLIPISQFFWIHWQQKKRCHFKWMNFGFHQFK